MIPHHLAYPKGRRGVNWECFDEACTPVVEIYSEHGNSEDDRGPFPYFTHSMGGRETSNTARAALEAGLRFGFVGSSDDHAGFPGAYGEGLMAALVADFSREGIFDAIRARRTYALTGDRIELDFAVDGAPMGSTIDGRQPGRGFIRRAGPRRAGRGRGHPGRPRRASRLRGRGGAGGEIFSAPVQVRLEWGWGPWGALALDRVCDWAMRVDVEQGRIKRFFPVPAVDAVRRAAPPSLRTDR